MHGEGKLVIEKANLFDVPQLNMVKRVVNAFQGKISSSNAIENMEFDFKIESKDGKLRMRNRSLKLTGREVTVLARGGYVGFDGSINLTLLPFDAGAFYELVRIFPGLAYTFTGYLWDYEVSMLPSILSPSWIKKQLIPGQLDDD